MVLVFGRDEHDSVVVSTGATKRPCGVMAYQPCEVSINTSNFCTSRSRLQNEFQPSTFSQDSMLIRSSDRETRATHTHTHTHFQPYHTHFVRNHGVPGKLMFHSCEKSWNQAQTHSVDSLVRVEVEQ